MAWALWRLSVHTAKHDSVDWAEIYLNTLIFLTAGFYGQAKMKIKQLKHILQEKSDFSYSFFSIPKLCGGRSDVIACMHLSAHTYTHSQ